MKRTYNDKHNIMYMKNAKTRLNIRSSNWFYIANLKVVTASLLLLAHLIVASRNLSEIKEVESDFTNMSGSESSRENEVVMDTTISDYDIIIGDGKIIDGTGNAWYYGDIGVMNDKIMKIGNLKKCTAKRRIDADGMFISPGFIDMHTHSDRSILKVPTADNFIRQGITTTVAGNCGASRLPIVEFLDKVNKDNKSINFITLVGHSSIRKQVMGQENRLPSKVELSEMQRIVRESMEAGAFGLSTGLFYTPANYADTEEIIELAKIVAIYGGIYASHIRDEGRGLLDAINEAIQIGKKAGLPVQISHIKCEGKQVWNKSKEVLNIIKNGREEGVDVLFDQYPYTASSTHIWGALFPSWAKEGGPSEFFERLEDKDVEEKIILEMQEKIGRAHV